MKNYIFELKIGTYTCKESVNANSWEEAIKKVCKFRACTSDAIVKMYVNERGNQ